MRMLRLLPCLLLQQLQGTHFPLLELQILMLLPLLPIA